MIIKRLKLQNFLSHKNTDVEFAEDGITVFIGENGAGKSSIVEGIVFCLFGKTDRGNLSELVSWGRNRATLELEFKKGKDLYKIERTVEIKGKRTLSTGVVYKYERGRYIPYYQKNISREIPKLTGISQKTFYSSVFVKQGDIEGLLNLPPKERAKVFEDILDMTLYQILSEAAAQRRRTIRSMAEALRSSIGNIPQLKEELKKITQQITEQNAKKEQLRKRLEEHDREYAEKKSVLEVLIKEKEKNIKNLSKLEKAKELLNISIKQRENLKEKIREIESFEKKLPQLQVKVEKLKKLEEDLEKVGELDVIKEKIKSISDKIKEYRKREKIVRDLEELANKFLKAEKRLNELKGKLRELEKIKGEAKTITRQKELISGKSEEILEKLSQILSELINYRNSYFILKNNPLMIEQFIKNNEEKISQLQVEKDKIKEEKGSLKAYGEELKNKINNIQNIEGKCPTCSRPLDPHTKEELLEEIENELKKKREEYKKLNKKEKEIEESLDTQLKIQRLLKEFKELFDRYTELKNELSQLNTKLAVLNSKMKNSSSLQEEEKNLENFMEENRKNYQTFTEAKNFIKSMNVKELESSLSKLEREKESIQRQLKGKDKKHLKEEITELKKVEEEYQKLLQIVSQKEEIISELSAADREIDRLNKIISELSSVITDESILDKKISSAKAEIEDVENRIRETTEEISKIKGEIGKLNGIRESLEKEIRKAEEKVQEAEELEKKAKRYEKIEQALGHRGIQRLIRENAMYELPRITNTLFSQFGFPFQQVRFSEEFDIQLLVPSAEKKDRYVSVNSISGGQRVALGLALRLAVGRFLSSKADFLILDEPTIHLDQQRRNELVNILISLKQRQLVRQLILVTHDTEIEDAADSIYYVENGSIKSVI